MRLDNGGRRKTKKVAATLSDGRAGKEFLRQMPITRPEAASSNNAVKV